VPPRPKKNSKYLGVTTSGGKYQAFVKVKARRVHCGQWREEGDAALARDRALLYFGLDAPLNLPRQADKAGPAPPKTLLAQARAKQRTSETSRFQGVHWDSRRGRWAAIVCIGRKPIQIAQFDDEEAAAMAYDRVAKHLDKTGSDLNFPRRRLKPASIQEMRKWSRALWKRKTTSRFRGVTFDKRSVKWKAQIGHQGGHAVLGYYDYEEDAARAYDAEARKVFGRGATLNFR
jgi:hypothetical protein